MPLAHGPTQFESCSKFDFQPLHAPCTSCVCVPVQLRPASKQRARCASTLAAPSGSRMSAVEGVDAFAQDDSEVQLLLAPLSEARARSLVSSADGSLQRFACHISHP